MPDNDPGVLARELGDLIDGVSSDGSLGPRAIAFLNQLHAYLESRAPVGVTVGEPALTGLEEVTTDWREALASAIESLHRHDLAEWELHLIGRRVDAALQANGVSGSPTSPKQTSELEEAGNALALGKGSLMK